MDMTSKKRWLFIGRWQPFHAGHKALIATGLAEGHRVIIAIRDTEITKDDPYSYRQRRRMIKRWLRSCYGRQWRRWARITKIPDLDVVVVGRNVGYKVVQLDVDMQQVSGTEIREKLRRDGKL